MGALTIIATPILKRKKFTWWTVGVLIISSIIMAVNGIYSTCKDGWMSSSIGKQGACSWHGGIVTRLNDFGWIVIIISATIIVGAYVYFYYKGKKIK